MTGNLLELYETWKLDVICSLLSNSFFLIVRVKPALKHKVRIDNHKIIHQLGDTIQDHIKSKVKQKYAPQLFDPAEISR